MASKWDWETGEGVSHIDDPAEVDAAFERGEWPLGSAVIGLAFNCSLEEASPRIVRAMQLPDLAQRGFAFTAAGAAARLNGKLTPELYEALRAEGHKGLAEYAIDDTLAFVPFRRLPPWLKWRKLWTGVRNKLESWWLRSGETVEEAWQALRRRS
ncbi:hypothetical protein ADL01_20195 [Streptomyces sp. NRRL WC-3618]|uniref:hypothetical protein n=1 Tax=Streptomyces sp. NRRL WC-3618 TaxID=1519490 RepID=UPI0006AE9F66|nr:hypothetical protein [Streptomyces sp. NRRL WC-3618]KOV71296.1 hypothetical protein ADL01_20195 [Streptomyces sp. NRRL WC-3618]